MNGAQAAEMVRRERRFLSNIVKDFKPEHGDFCPADGMMTVAQQIRHVARTVKWFREGAFGAGFNMDFEKLEAEIRNPVTLDEAVAELDEVYDDYIAFLEALTEEDLMAPMPANPIFGDAPKMAAIGAGSDHTAHHRGALSVYLRLLGIKPAMVYEE